MQDANKNQRKQRCHRLENSWLTFLSLSVSSTDEGHINERYHFLVDGRREC